MRFLMKISAITMLLIIFIYACNITSIPDSIILFEGEKLKIKTINGLSIEPNEKYMTTQVSSSIGKEAPEKIGKTDYSLKLLDTFNVKDIAVNVIPKTKVVPVGNIIGLKLYTKGVLVVGLSDKSINYGIEEGDTILAINESEISSTEELIDKVISEDGKNIEIKYDRNGEIKTANIVPNKTKDGTYKLGLWVRDAAAGVGTITYYEPETKMFVALGHGIQDVDTGQLITIQNGEIVKASIIDIKKGEKNNPGEIRGNITQGEKVGTVYKNTLLGIYGTIDDTSTLNINTNDAIDVASREEIEEGLAKMICMLDDGIKKEYNIEIKKIYKDNNKDNKSMLIKVIDDELIQKTGGIIQGMSGSPIIQNGKFIGAITHVLVQNPTEGYAVFADMMIKQMREVE